MLAVEKGVDPAIRPHDAPACGTMFASGKQGTSIRHWIRARLAPDQLAVDGENRAFAGRSDRLGGRKFIVMGRIGQEGHRNESMQLIIQSVHSVIDGALHHEIADEGHIYAIATQGEHKF